VTGIQPELVVRRGRQAVAFYVEAFGAAVLHQVGGTDEEPEVVAQLAAGDAVFWVHDEAPGAGLQSPGTLGGSSVRLLLVVDDPATVVDRAERAGATVEAPVQDEHGWRLGRLRDPFGHHWEIGRPLGTWPPGYPVTG
jgi:PhnB protein